MKCEITKEPIQTTFLGKIIGTVIKDEKGKKHYISAKAQEQYKNNKQAILKKITS